MVDGFTWGIRVVDVAVEVIVDFAVAAVYGELGVDARTHQPTVDVALVLVVVLLLAGAGLTGEAVHESSRGS